MTNLRTMLNVAARQKQQFGATVAQIDYICALADERGLDSAYFGNITGLTKAQASGMIDRMINPIEALADEYVARAEALHAETADANKAALAHEAAKAAWIAKNYPDYDTRDTKARKRIRHAAGKAVGGAASED